MTKPLLSEITAKAEHDLLRIALLVGEDASMAAVLWDATVEMGWHHEMVLPLCFGVPLDPVPPTKLRTLEARGAWQRKRRESISFANTQGYIYRDNPAPWARAVLSALLFGGWDASMQSRYGTRAPWPIVRANAQAPAVARREAYRRARQALAEGRLSIPTIAEQFSGE